MLITASGVLILGVTLYSDLSGLGRLSALSIFWGPIGVAALLYGLRYIISPTKPIAVAESRVMSTIGNAATDFVKLVAYAVLWMIFSLASVPAAGFGAGFLFEVLVPEKSISKAHVESGPDDVAQDEILAEQQVTAHAILAERQRKIAHAIWLGQLETAFVTGFGAAFVGNILLYILYYARFKPRLRN